MRFAFWNVLIWKCYFLLRRTLALPGNLLSRDCFRRVGEQQRFSEKFPVSSHHELHSGKFTELHWLWSPLYELVWSTKDHLQSFATICSNKLIANSNSDSLAGNLPEKHLYEFLSESFSISEICLLKKKPKNPDPCPGKYPWDILLEPFSLDILLCSLDILDCSPWAILLSHSPQTFSLTIFPSDIFQDCQINFLKI